MENSDKNDVNDLYRKAHALREAGDLKGASHILIECIKLTPNSGDTWASLASVRRLLGQVDASVALNLRALEHHSSPQDMMINLVNALVNAGRPEDILDLTVKLASQQKRPSGLDDTAAARAMFEQGRPRLSLPHFENALKKEECNHKLRLGAAMALLQIGAFKQAFEALEARWLTGTYSNYTKKIPRWDGGKLSGKRVLIVGEQGLGDVIFMCRFLPKMKEFGAGRMSFAVRPPLVRLIEQMGLCDEVVRFPKDIHIDELLDDADIWLPAFDMMRYSAATPADVPPPSPFQILKSSADRAKNMVAPYAKRFKIGIVWKSEEKGERHREKSIDLTRFLSLCEFRGIQLFSLHKGPGVEDIETLGASGLIVDAGSSDEDLADTAALMKELNLVITIDTAAAHLAGSLGVPTWVLTPEPPHWYWWGVGEGSQYYPGLRLIRQSKRFVWDDVFARIQNDLSRTFN